MREIGNVFTRYLNSVWSKEILILIYSDKLCEIYLLRFFNYLEESFLVILDSVSGFRIPDFTNFTTRSRSFPVLLGCSLDEAQNGGASSQKGVQRRSE